MWRVQPVVSFGPGTHAGAAGATAYPVSLSINSSPGNNGNTIGAAVSYHENHPTR